MKKNIWVRLAALALSAIVLTGCAAPSVSKGNLPAWATPYSRMAYTRPDPSALQALAQEVLDQATGTEALVALEEFYSGYDQFYTNSSLAELRNCADLTDDYWAAEREYCYSVEAEAEQIKESLMESLARSPLRQELEQTYFGTDFFRAYDQESFYSPKLMTLLQEDHRLQAEYYSLQDSSAPLGFASRFANNSDKLADILVELIRIRQQIAATAGYDSYPAFANDYYYYREYTPAMVSQYLSDVQRELVPLYKKYKDLAFTREKCTEKQLLAYVEQTAASLGGKVQEAYQLMQAAELYDIVYSQKKYDSSFEVYLYSYAEPFVFLNPSKTVADKMTLTHEFGHFCNDYACGGTTSGIDVMEVFSQALEYLSLFCGEPDTELIRFKLADSLCTFVEQCCFASFEQQMYDLQGDALTREALYALYAETAGAYGMDGPFFDARELVSINHFYTNPMYVISYVFSNDAAMQFYEQERTAAGQGSALYLSLLDKDFSYFLDFVKAAGLKSPFIPGRVQELRQDLEAVLGN